MASSHLLLFVFLCSFYLLGLGSTEHNFVVVPTRSLPSEPACSTMSQVTSDPNRAFMPLVHRHGPCLPSGANSAIKPSLAEMLRRDRARKNHIINKALGRTNTLSDAGVNIPTVLGSAVDSLAYVVTLGLGTPAVQQTVLIDTGSDLSWVQCQPCNATECYPQKDPLFDPSKSSTYKTISCQSDECKNLAKDGYHGDCTNGATCSFSILYGDGSNTTGEYGRETLTLAPGVTVSDFHFGCGHGQKNLTDKFDGLLGLGGASESLVSQTAEKYGGSFSYCLPPGNGTAGFLALGAPSNDTAGFVFSPMHRFHGLATFYTVTLAGISVGGKQLDIPPALFANGMIVDSGSLSAYPLLPPNDLDLDTCYNFTGHSNVTVPKVSLTFSGGASIDLNVPSGVLVEDCLAFAGDIADNSPLFGVIGNVNQRTFEVLYDSTRGKVGFRPGAC
ncbi:hypothetical protein EJB05_45113, partial [Eragrostis curvula]